MKASDIAFAINIGSSTKKMIDKKTTKKVKDYFKITDFKKNDGASLFSARIKRIIPLFWYIGKGVVPYVHTRER